MAMKNLKPYVDMANQIGNAMISASRDLGKVIGKQADAVDVHNLLVNAALLHFSAVLADQVMFMKECAGTVYADVDQFEKVRLAVEDSIQGKMGGLIADVAAVECGSSSQTLRVDVNALKEDSG